MSLTELVLWNLLAPHVFEPFPVCVCNPFCMDSTLWRAIFKVGAHHHYVRLISVVDVVITPMNPYQPIPFHILSIAIFQS